VGRGALFGPVFAAAVILNPAQPVRGLDDSKALDPERREVLHQRICERAVAWAIGAADPFEIDQVNILEASRLAMRRAVEKLRITSDYLLIDAIRIHLPVMQKPLIHGDSLSFSIAAASIVAKVERDRAMKTWDCVFPEYGLASNKGYSTPDHLSALDRLGPTPLHRFSFSPVREAGTGVRAAGPAFCPSFPSWNGYPQPAQPAQEELFPCL
jgi:ribonuclease HII